MLELLSFGGPWLPCRTLPSVAPALLPTRAEHWSSGGRPAARGLPTAHGLAATVRRVRARAVAERRNRGRNDAIWRKYQVAAKQARGDKKWRPGSWSPNKDGTYDAGFNKPTSRDDDHLVSVITSFMRPMGGKCRFDVIQNKFRVEPDWADKYFDLDRRSGWHTAIIKLRPSEEFQDAETDLAAKSVARSLFKLGGVGDLHDLCRRHGIRKVDLLKHDGGKIFEVKNGQIFLVGGAFAVAAAAAATGKVTAMPGRRKSSTDLFTSDGLPTDTQEARRLLLRIEGLIASTGEDRLQSSSLYAALGLTPLVSLRRWIGKHSGLIYLACGNIKLNPFRLKFFRVQRALKVANMMIECGGSAPLDAVIGLIHRPRELAVLEAEEKAKQKQKAQRPNDVRPPGGGYGHEDYGDDPEGGDFPKPLSIMLSEPPPWIEEWVRKYFVVEQGMVYFPNIKTRTLRGLYGEPSSELATHEAMLLKVQEEIRLRYGRCALTSLSGSFGGVRKAWVQHFFDVTVNGEVIDKTANRQIDEAVAITEKIFLTEGQYSVVDAFNDFGCDRRWLQQFFRISADDLLETNADSLAAWDPPEEDKAPDPRKYAVLDAPKRWRRFKDDKNPYAVRTPFISAGGIGVQYGT